MIKLKDDKEKHYVITSDNDSSTEKTYSKYDKNDKIKFIDAFPIKKKEDGFHGGNIGSYIKKVK